MSAGMRTLHGLVRDPLRLATGEFLHELGERHGGWSWVVTLTMTWSLPKDRLIGALRLFARGLAVYLHDHYALAFSTEYRSGIDGAHSHALLGGNAVRRATKRDIERSWKLSDELAGFSRVARYSSGVSAELYLAKEADSWSGGIVCPRVGDCGHRTCKHGPSPF